MSPIKQMISFKNIFKQREYVNLEAIIKAEDQARLDNKQEEAEVAQNRSS